MKNFVVFQLLCVGLWLPQCHGTVRGARSKLIKQLQDTGHGLAPPTELSTVPLDGRRFLSDAPISAIAGTYSTESMWGGNSGKWGNGGRGELIIAMNGVITFNNVEIPEYEYDEDSKQLTWQTPQVVDITFHDRFTSAYYFKDLEDNTGTDVFIGSVRAGTNGALDFRGFLLPAPTASPTPSPSETPSEAPSATPSEAPSVTPSEAPSTPPTEAPSVTPSETPTLTPTEAPSVTPSEAPSEAPSVTPSDTPSVAPSIPPTEVPSAVPTMAPIPIAEVAGTYNTESRWGGRSGKWGNAGRSTLTITERGVVTFGGVEIVDYNYNENTKRLKWESPQAVGITFYDSLQHDYYFGDQPKDTGENVFKGSLTSGTNGAVDFRGFLQE